MRSVSRAASTTSLVTLCKSLMRRMRSIWVNSRCTSLKLPPVIRAIAATAAGRGTDGWLPGVVVLQQEAAHDRGEAPVQRLELRAQALRRGGGRRRIGQRAALSDVPCWVRLRGGMHLDVRATPVPAGKV